MLMSLYNAESFDHFPAERSVLETFSFFWQKIALSKNYRNRSGIVLQTKIHYLNFLLKLNYLISFYRRVLQFRQFCFNLSCTPQKSDLRKENI